MVNTLKEDFYDFSRNWEEYLQLCREVKDESTIFKVKSNHIAYKLLIEGIPQKLENLISKKNYQVESSLGKGYVAGIPWISIFNKQVTTTVQEGFYIVYLFSRNAKKIYLSIGLGAEQFKRVYSNHSICVEKINAAKERFKSVFNSYSPINIEQSMDLLDETDTDFTRKDSEFSIKSRKRIDTYEAGCLFTKSYDLNEGNLNEEELIGDLEKYLISYESIIEDPISVPLVENLVEAVFQKDEIKQEIDLNYEIPNYVPSRKETAKKSSSGDKLTTKKTERNIKRSLPSKKVGSAGEEHVFKYEFNKLKKAGKEELASKIIKQYEDYSSFPGYDIQSYDVSGNEIYIEVKSTKGSKKDFFEISDNEVRSARKHRGQYFIYHVVNALTKPKIDKIIKDPIGYVEENQIILDPWIYQMRI